VFGDIGSYSLLKDECSWFTCFYTDPKKIEETRTGIPVTIQRRFDVYQDVSATA